MHRKLGPREEGMLTFLHTFSEKKKKRERKREGMGRLSGVVAGTRHLDRGLALVLPPRT